MDICRPKPGAKGPQKQQSLEQTESDGPVVYESTYCSMHKGPHSDPALGASTYGEGQSTGP